MEYWHRQTWPRLEDQKHEIACPFCDSLHEVVLIEEGQDAHCITCQQLLYRNRPQSLERAVAFGFTGILFFMAMLWLPFMHLDTPATEISITFRETISRIWESGGFFISISVLVFIYALPLLQLFSLIYLCLPLLIGRILPGSVLIAKFLQGIQAWVMVEVFFLATIVSLLKLVKLADVTLGYGFWSMIGLMLSIAAAIGGVDRLELWDRIEVAQQRKNTPETVEADQVESELSC